MPKNSMWKHLLSQAVLKLKEQEEIEEIYQKWFPAACANNGTGSTEYEPVQINYFGGLIFILTMFLIVSIVLFGGEHFCYRHHRRVINPIQTKVQVWRETKATERRNAIINPEDINYLQQLHQNGMIGTTNACNNSDAESSSDGDISEGEEELIRMRLGRRNPGAKSEIVSPVQRTSLDSLGKYYASTTVRRGSCLNTASMEKLFSIPTAFHKTLEMRECEPKEVCHSIDEESIKGENDMNLGSTQSQDECSSIGSKPYKNDTIIQISSDTEEEHGSLVYPVENEEFIDCSSKKRNSTKELIKKVSMETIEQMHNINNESTSKVTKIKDVNNNDENCMKDICLETIRTDSNNNEEYGKEQDVKSKVNKQPKRSSSSLSVRRRRPLEVNTFVRNHTLPLCGKQEFTVIDIVSDDRADLQHNDNDSNYFSANSNNSIGTVSYTHLTLPTICSV